MLLIEVHSFRRVATAAESAQETWIYLAALPEGLLEVVCEAVIYWRTHTAILDLILFILPVEIADRG